MKPCLCQTIFRVLPLVLVCAAACADEAQQEPHPSIAARKFIAKLDGNCIENNRGEVLSVVLEGEWGDSLTAMLDSSDLSSLRDHLKAFPKLESVSLRVCLQDARHLADLADFPELTVLTIESGSEELRLVDELKVLAGNNRLRELDLGGCPIGDDGLVHLAGMPALDDLWLYNTGITDAGLKSLRGMKLKRLSLGRNRLRGTGLAELAAMETLEILDLRDNVLDDAAIAHLASLKRLKVLWLESNRGTDRGVAILARLPALEVVGLENNDVSDAALDLLQPVKSLRELNVSKTRATVGRLRQFHQARGAVKLKFDPMCALGLQHVWPAGTVVELNEAYGVRRILFNCDGILDDAAARIAQYPELEHLTVVPYRAQFGPQAARHFAGLTRLKELHLRAGNVTDQELVHLKDLKQLEWLDLDEALITDAGLARLKHLPNLATLNLAKTGITDAGLRELATWPGLKELDVSDTPVTMAGIREFIRKRPKTVIYETEDGVSHGDWRAKEQQAQGDVLLTISPRTALGLNKVWPPRTVVLLNDRLEVNRVRFQNRPDDAQIVQLTKFPEIEQVDFPWDSIPPGSLRHLARLPKLKHLELCRQWITDGDVAHLAPCTKLEYLDLSGTKITDRGTAHLAGLTKLKTLLLRNTSVGDAGLRKLTRLTALETLELQHTAVTGEGLKALAAMQQLKNLQLARAKVTDNTLTNLWPLINLERLGLENTGITDRGLAHLAALPGLTELVLFGNSISDDGLPELYGLKQLRHVNLHNTETTVEGRDALRLMLPNAIVWPEDE